MFRSSFPVRRLAAALVLIALAGVLAACSRKSNILTPVVSPPFTWRNGIQHLMADRSEGTAPTGCTSCHHTGTGIPDWSDYATVVGDSGQVVNRLTAGTMRSFLKPGEPETVIQWIHDGAPY